METVITKQPGWQDLFPTNSSVGETFCWRVLHRRGEPLLVIPASAPAAAKSLALYPAQTVKARLLRNILGAGLKLHLPLPLTKVELTVDPAAPFPRFLAAQAGVQGLPQLGILAGNPRTVGRRFVLLVFGADGAPVRVVKAGLGEAAKVLIEREANFLAAVPAAVAGLPKLGDTFRAENLHALALEFLDGEFSSGSDSGEVPKLMNAWVMDEPSRPLSATAPWRELAIALAAGPRWQRLGQLGNCNVPRVIWHGDFAPWNLRLDRRTGRCVALDWERGQLGGVPGWDWFHFVVQTGVLVNKLSTTGLREKLESLLRADEFGSYARRCGVAGFARELALAYLLYNLEVIKPSEGRAEIRALLEQLTDAWTSDSKS